MADDRAAPEPAPGRHAEIAGSQGFQAGDGNVQVNFLLGGQPTGPVVAGEIPQEPVAFQPRDELLEAILLDEATLAGYERVLGQAHPDTLTSRNNLAYAYQMAGRVGEAIPLYEVTLAGYERVLGQDHPDTLASRNNLAYAYRVAGAAG